MHDYTFSAVFGVVMGFGSYCLGWNPHIDVLLWAITLDIIVGVLACFINDDLTFNSRKMYKGIVKKIIVLTLVAFSHQLDIMIGTEIIGLTVTYFFVGNEGMSILENCGKCGIVYPEIIKNSLEQLKKGGKSNDSSR